MYFINTSPLLLAIPLPVPAIPRPPPVIIIVPGPLRPPAEAPHLHLLDDDGPHLRALAPPTPLPAKIQTPGVAAVGAGCGVDCGPVPAAEAMVR